MNMKKILPLLLLIIMAVIAISLKRCNANRSNAKPASSQNRNGSTSQRTYPSGNESANGRGLDRNPNRLFYTKHARCRMACRHITQQEVEDILINGSINYNKSELDNPRGPKYAVEGNTADGQKVRIIFAPNTQHISVVTVIDLVEDFACSCD